MDKKHLQNQQLLLLLQPYSCPELYRALLLLLALCLDFQLTYCFSSLYCSHSIVLSWGRQFIYGVIGLQFDCNLSAFCNSGGLKRHFTSAPLHSSVCSVLSPSRDIFRPIMIISETTCSCWLLYAVLLSDRWCWYKLIGCWSKWRALHCRH